MAQPLFTRERLDIRSESLDQPRVRALLQDLDAYLGSLYAPQDNHILSVDELLSPQVCFLVARSCGYRRRGAFGAYPDNGLSLFYEKRLDR